MNFWGGNLFGYFSFHLLIYFSVRAEDYLLGPNPLKKPLAHMALCLWTCNWLKRAFSCFYFCTLALSDVFCNNTNTSSSKISASTHFLVVAVLLSYYFDPMISVCSHCLAPDSFAMWNISVELVPNDCKERHGTDALSDLQLSWGNTTYSQVIGDRVAFE